jgi:hypothetical protein
MRLEFFERSVALVEKYRWPRQNMNDLARVYELTPMAR